MADEAVAEQTLDEQLEALWGSETPVSAPGKTPKAEPGKAAPLDASPADAATEVDPLEEALKTIEEEKPEEKPAEPQMSDEQKSILAAVPSAEVATQLYGTVQSYNNFTGAFEARNFEAVDSMFEKWDPAAYEAFMDHVYEKHVKTGEWVDRFIAEQEGRGGEHKGMKAVQREIAQLKAQLNQREAGAQQNTQQAAEQRSFQAYTAHVNDLFEKIKFSANDRRWVVADLNAKVAADPKVLAALKSGNPTAANALFKQAVREYTSRDKQVAQETGDKIDAQSAKKAPLAGGVGQQEGTDALPDDIKQVPKGKEDSWMDQQFAKLAKKAGLKR